MKCSITAPAGGCGIYNYYNFGSVYGYSNLRHVSLGGAGLGIASFINTKRCQQAYEILAKRFKIVYQSTPRLNENSGNMFFMCVYEQKVKWNKAA